MSKVSEQIKIVMKQENLSWATAAKQARFANRSNFRRSLLTRLDRAEELVNLLGWEIKLVKREE